MRHSRGLKRCQSEVWGRGSRAGRQVGSDRAPHPPPQHTLSWRGVERVAWAAGPGGTASGPQPPASPPRRRSNFTKSEISRRPRGRRHRTVGGGARSRGPRCGRTFAGRWALGGGWRGRRASPCASAGACVSGLTFVRARAASAAEPSTRVFCNQSVRLIKGGATAS